MRSASIIMAMCWAALAEADSRTYHIIPAAVAPDCPDVLAGGTITTDGTFGLLLPKNILSMSVDIRLGVWVLEHGIPPQFHDGSTTLDLTNAALSLNGEIVATPSGIFVAAPPPSPYQRGDFGASIPPADPNVKTYSLALDGGDAHVRWSSVNLEVYGINNFVSVESLPAGGAGMHFAQSGLIARVVPEPATWVLVVGIVAPIRNRRRRL